MSIAKVNHSVWQAHNATALTVSGGATPNALSEWWDVNGWTDKVISVLAGPTDGGGVIDLNVNIYVSPKGYYELNNETTVDTEDYENISIVDAQTATIMTRYDSSDVDDLQRPIRSMAVLVDNDEATEATTVNVWVEGWS